MSSSTHAPFDRTVLADDHRAAHVLRPAAVADLLRRVFADDVLQCPCGGRRSPRRARVGSSCMNSSWRWRA
jgi:hypothetical protein